MKRAAQTVGAAIQADGFEAYELFNDDERGELSSWNAGHWIGGYPYFMQDDVREVSSEFDTLLFQMDSESIGEGEIMWGDMGVGNFFISREALRRLDFSRVLYHWDCC